MKAAKLNGNLKLNKMEMKMVDTVTFTFRWFDAFRFTFFCDLPVLFTTCVTVGFQFVVSRHQTLSITVTPGSLFVSTR